MDPHPAAHLREAAALSRLVDELPLGVALLAPDGSVRAANPAAASMLEGAGGAGLAAALARLVARAELSAARLSEAVLPSAQGEVRVLLTPAGGDGYLALLGPEVARRLRDQAVALRGLLARAAGPDPLAALPRSLETLLPALGGGHLALWAARPGGVELLASASAPGYRATEPGPEGDGALAARAIEGGVPVHVPRMARRDGLGPREQREAGAALALPLRGPEERVRGALVASCPRLGEGELRLLMGLADGAAALLARAEAEEARRAAEAALERAAAAGAAREGLATLGHFAACIGHELVNPLACLGSGLRQVQATLRELRGALAAPGGAALPELAAEAEETLAESVGDVQRMGSLLRAMKSLTRGAPHRSERFAPLDAVEDAVRILRGAHRSIELRVTVPAPVADVRGSAGLLCQAVLNLLDNGLQAMGGQGPLEVRLFEARPGEGEGHRVVIEVADRGGGIAPELAGRIYEPYFSTKPAGKGTGLGLHVCKSAVELMGGTIAHDSGPEGTTFRIELPPAP